MSKTAADLANRVLFRLEIIAAGETPTAEDVQTVTDFYADQHAELSVDHLVYWDTDAIPDEAFQALADLIAGRIAPDFGLSRPDLEASGDARLRRLSSQGGTGRTVTSDYF